MERKVNLKNILFNIQALKKRTRAKLCAVIKCNAYGHGAIAVAKFIESNVDCFAVANAVEAEELVNSGISKEIIVLSAFYDGKNYPKNVIFTAYNEQTLLDLIRSGRRFALKVNSGMNRLGFDPNKCIQILNCVSLEKIHSVYSHLSDSTTAKEQLLAFSKIITAAPKHICASNFLDLPPCYHLDMVRCGLALYGVGSKELRQALFVTCKIINVNRVLSGERIGYGDFRIDHDAVVATVDVGYGDGLMRLHNSAECFLYLKGIPCKVVGQICMDSCMIEVPRSIIAKVGDEVEVIGENNTPTRLAKSLKTIPYEVLTSFSQARGDLIYIK